MSVCSQCSKLSGYGGCCRVPPSSAEYQFPITLEDAQLIKAHTGKDLEEFIEIDKVSAFVAKSFQKISPFLYNQVVDGYRVKLKLKENGECVFLDPEAGCTIKSVRPLICKMFPFFPDESGYLSPKLSSNCLAKDLADSKKSDILSMLGQKGEDLLEDTQKLKKNISSHQEKMRPLLKSFNIID